MAVPKSIDDQVVIGIEVRGADGVRDAVGTDFERVAIPDLQPRLDARLQDERIEPEVLAAAAPQRVDDVRHDGTEGDLLDAGRIAAVFPEHAAQEQPQLVRRRGRPRRLAETDRQLAVVKHAAEDLAVADIERQNHGRPPSGTLSISRTSPRRTAPSRRPSRSST